MQPEGARLDYKGIAFPKDLSKTIAAFANTLGGLIILGVDADKKTNTPIWPPVAGMPMEAGLSERVQAWLIQSTPTLSGNGPLPLLQHGHDFFSRHWLGCWHGGTGSSRWPTDHAADNADVDLLARNRSTAAGSNRK
jgi:hypothetical protein